MQTAEERRDSLMAQAAQLNVEIRALTTRVQSLISALVGEGDTLLPAVADEKEASRGVRKRAVVYTGTIPAPTTEGAPAVALGAGKRACSVCRQPGHRAGNAVCPGTIAAYNTPRGKK